MEMAATRTCNESWLMLLLVVGVLMVWPTCGVLQLHNSTLACTRGSNQTNHKLDCKSASAVGAFGGMFLSRIFCGALRNTSGCSLNAPYSSCCVRSLDECIFQCNNRMEEYVKKVTGWDEFSFQGSRESTSGKCAADLYPTLSSFSFIEYGCVPTGLLANIWSNSSQEQQGEVYLGTNFNVDNSNVHDSETECVVKTDCNSNLTFFALYFRLKTANYTPCPEELSFADFKYPNKSSTEKCDNSSLIYNKELFTSTSNSAVIRMNVIGNHTGKIFIRVRASNQIANVKIACGTDGKEAMKNIEICPNDPYVSSYTSSVTYTAATSSVIYADETSSVAYITNTQVGSPSSNVDGGTIAGIVLAVIAIILVSLLIIGIIVYRWMKCSKQAQENIYIEPSTRGPYFDHDSGLDDDYDKLPSSKSSCVEEASSVGSYDVPSLARSQENDYASIVDQSGRGIQAHSEPQQLGTDNLAFRNDTYR